VSAGGAGYAVGDQITLASGATTEPPIGAPVVLTVSAVAGGVVTAVDVVSQVINSDPVLGGSYFAAQAGPVAQGSTTGSGSGATFSLTFGPAQPQRVILTNQEFATLSYVKQVTDPDIWDPIFQDAMVNKLGADLVMALTGDKGLANACVAMANASIQEARKADGNEGLTINDVTPDWIRMRGINWTEGYSSGPYVGFDWGGLLPSY
jgi:hypothetical protein